MEQRKCHNCNGSGRVPTDKKLKQNPNLVRRSTCYYCRGKGFRTSYYGRDRI